MSLRTVFLDIDGTLLDSNGAHAQAWSEACAEFGYDRPASFFLPLIGMGGDRIFPKIDPDLSDAREPGKSISRRRQEMFLKNYAPHLRPTAGARAFVERLRDTGLARMVASSAKSDEIAALLRAAQVSDLIDDATTSDDAEQSKPAPDIIHTALKKADVQPAEAVLLGDTPYDVEAGRNAGVNVVAVRSGGWDDDALAGAVVVYDDPADILRHYDRSPFGIPARDGAGGVK
ncbi:MAG: HAD family hydrolase [Candidatus Eremiobacteraeota bacterium]|nr:HAD family hydrolase [Candidatus Eremiobacteraeota bacterium]MBC5828481.1 HAD family hydrolase [Candidatus Eremiobacteraeota bacterium]